MKKAAIIICLATVMMSQWASANPIGSAQALKNAQAFLQKKGIHATPGGMKRAPMVNDTGEEAPFYVFNLGNDRGFVIASGDDRATPILAYSDKGSMQTDSLPDRQARKQTIRAGPVGVGPVFNGLRCELQASWQRSIQAQRTYFTSMVTMRPLMGASPGMTSALVSMFAAL